MARQKKEWWRKYSYSRGDLLRKFILLAIVIYVVINYRGVLVAAYVNGEPIGRLEVVRQLEAQGGAETLESLINEKLISQKAQKANISIDSNEINSKIAELEEEIIASGQSVDDILALQGMTREDLEDQLEFQIKVEKLLSGDIQISEEDVTSYIDENKDFLPEGMSEEELKDIAKAQLEQQELAERFSTWIQELRDEANVNYFVSY